MEALFIFIAKSSGLLVLFYCAYYFLLRKETFFSSSRWFLLAGLITSIVLPFMVYTKIIWVEPAPVQNFDTVASSSFNYAANYSPHIAETPAFEINWDIVILAIYGIGFLVLIIKFGLDFCSLTNVLKGKKVQQEADFKFVDITENIAPFSYFDYIVYNSSMFTKAELENILEHEKVHSDQNHTMDVLISRVFCVLFWFNPIIWLYKKAILQNLEFIADSEAAKKIADKKAYQYTLLKITTHESCVAITNHFYQSLIKKRIVMLNKNQSKKRNYLKYYAIIPALVAFVILFQIKTVAQEKERKTTQQTVKENDSVNVFKFQKNTTDQELKQMAEKLKKNHNIDVVISDVKRNSKNELTGIKVDIKKQNNEIQSIHVDGDEPIRNCGIVITSEKNGTKQVNLIAENDDANLPVVKNRIVDVSQSNSLSSSMVPPTPPTPPAPPAFPNGAMPQAPKIDVPKPPVAPKNVTDKVAMAKFEKEMAAFDKKMEAFEPQMAAFEKQMEEFMEKRNGVYEKEMEKYAVAMEKFGNDMEKFNLDMQESFETDATNRDARREQYDIKRKEYEAKRKEHEANRRQHEKESRQREKEFRQEHKEKRKELESRRS